MLNLLIPVMLHKCQRAKADGQNALDAVVWQPRQDQGGKDDKGQRPQRCEHGACEARGGQPPGVYAATCSVVGQIVE